MENHPGPEDPAGTAPPGACLPIGASFLKATPGGGLINLRVHISDDPGTGPLLSADGWDVVRAGGLSICLKLET